MSLAELLADLNSRGISLVVNGDKLKRKGKESALTPELLETLREQKAELMALLAGMCFCERPMPPADVEGQPCKRCGFSGWCSTCGGCRWCAFEVTWRDNLLPKYRQRFK
jgi:hypothetical protein